MSKLFSDSKKYRYLRYRSKVTGAHVPGELSFDWTKSLYNRSAIISKVVNLVGAQSYLEIGCETDVVFKAIDCPHKVGVDPDKGGTMRATSDDFFASNTETFDVAFVDGLHTYQQVRQDILNTFKCLNDGGVILMHDCLPRSYIEQAVPRMATVWTGDVWKAAFDLKQNPDIDFRVISVDYGVGIMKARKNSDQKSFSTNDFSNVDFGFFQENYQDLGLIGYDDIAGFIGKN